MEGASRGRWGFGRRRGSKAKAKTKGGEFEDVHGGDDSADEDDIWSDVSLVRSPPAAARPQPKPRARSPVGDNGPAVSPVFEVEFSAQGSLGLSFAAHNETEPPLVTDIARGGLAAKVPPLPRRSHTHVLVSTAELPPGCPRRSSRVSAFG